MVLVESIATIEQKMFGDKKNLANITKFFKKFVKSSIELANKHTKNLYDEVKQSIAGVTVTSNTENLNASANENPITAAIAEVFINAQQEIVDLENEEIPLFIRKMYLNAAARAFAIYGRVGITKEWAKRKKRYAAILGGPGSPSFVLTGQFKDAVYDGLMYDGPDEVVRIKSLIHIGLHYYPYKLNSPLHDYYSSGNKKYLYGIAQRLHEEGKIEGPDDRAFFALTSADANKIAKKTADYIQKKYKQAADVKVATSSFTVK